MEQDTQIKVSKWISVCWFAFAIYALIYRTILVGQYANIVPAIFAVIIGLVVRKNCRVAINVAGVIILFLGYFNLVGVVMFNKIDRNDSLTASCYSISMNQLNYTGSFLPEELPGDAHNVSLQYLPTVLQGDGRTNVFFETSSENIDKYISYYSEKAILPVFTVKELADQENSPVLSHLKDYVEDSSPELHVTIPDYIKENYPNAKVYVIDSNFYWNHMYSQCFICDKEAGIVGFTEGA